MKDTKRYLLIILSILIISIVGTLAWLTWKSKETALVLTVGEIDGTRVTLKPYVIEDILIPELTYEGKEVIEVNIKNNGNEDSQVVLYYNISKIDDELITDNFKYTILRSTDNGNSYTEYKEGNFVNANISSDFIILKEDIPKNTEYNYQIYTWLDGSNETSSSIQGKVFKAELNASIYNEKDIIIDLPEGMIPVTIANDGVVTTIAKDNASWYDYDEKKWANAVLVTETSRSTYLDTDGVIIPESNILAYYVYIPRYKYKIWTVGTSAEGQEQEIEIVFENKYTDKSTGTQVGEYLTHPAFTFGNTELSGIWVGKFETTGDGTTPTIKPNVKSLVSQNISSEFITGLKFAGGTLSNGTTTFSGSSTYGLTASTDSHMMKNSEWGAVAYLSHSKYGINSEIRINNYYSSGFKTGCGASTASASQSTTCGITYGGSSTYPQSTTGNISGIFDMSGGSWERVMGVFANSSGVLWSGGSTYNSGFNGLLGSSGTAKTDGITFPESKYYDVYRASSGTTINILTACNGGVCYGHGISEVSNWYGDYNGFISSTYPWFYRGGGTNNTTEAGIFYYYYGSGNAHTDYGFRSTICFK